MDAPRAVLATHDRREALEALGRLEGAGVAGELILSSPGFGVNRFDAECGVDPFYPFNLVVEAVDQERAQALLAEAEADDRSGESAEALAPEVEETGPIRTGYDRPAYLAARVLLLIVFLTHLPRALLIAGKAPRPAGLVLAALAVALWLGWGAALAVVSGPAAAAVLLGGLGFTVGLFDALLTRRRFVLLFAVAEALAVAAVAALGLSGGLP